MTVTMCCFVYVKKNVSSEKLMLSIMGHLPNHQGSLVAVET